MNTIILAGLERGLQMQDIRRMTIGQVVDFIQDYNERSKEAEREAERRKSHPVKHYRYATQEEIDAL